MNIKEYMAIAVLALSAAAASAGELTAEYRWGDNGNQYKGEFSEKIKTSLGTIAVSGELESKQGYNDGKLDAVISGTVGYPVALPYGFTAQPFVQIGEKLASGSNQANFIGEGVKLSRTILGPVSGEVAYRHRGSYSNADLSENRLAASVKYTINKKNAIGAVVYNYSGQSVDHRYGLFYKYSL